MKETKEKKSKNTWVLKDRIYMLKNNMSPVTYTIKSKNIYWFDEEKGYERELKYTVNQKTLFVDEFKGPETLGHVIFEDGVLRVPREKQTLQKLLSLYHPKRNILFFEYDAEAKAKDEVDIIELEIEALLLAKQMELAQAEAIVRVNVGSEVSKMTSKEVKRDLLVFAKKDPELFLELANDENIELRNIGIKAIEQSIITLSQDRRTINWASTNKKLMTVPFDENPYSALAAWFKTDEGVEVLKTIEKKLA
tara:strand:+ start:136 stop:888 length:753 start_codon:yes stop_codon:yes gene_type:complete